MTAPGSCFRAVSYTHLDVYKRQLAISFEEAAFGCEKAVTVERYET